MRMTRAFSRVGGSSLVLNGSSNPGDMVTLGGGLANGVDPASLLGDSSFVLELFPDGDGSGSLAVWGLGGQDGMSAGPGEGALFWDGENHSGHVGIDARVGSGLLLGMAASVTGTDAAYDNGRSTMAGRGGYAVRTVGMHPYLAWSSADGRMELRGSSGYGSGEVRVVQDGYGAETAVTRLFTATVAGSGVVYGSGSGSGSEVRVRGEAWTADQHVAANGGLIGDMWIGGRRVSVAAEGSHRHELASGGSLKPHASVDAHWQGGMKQTLGLAAGTGMAYAGPSGISASGLGRIPLASAVPDSAWGLSGLLEYDADGDGLGTLVSVSPAWGDSAGGTGMSLLDGGWDDGSDSGGGMRFGAEVGYGVAVLDGGWTVTPFSRIDWRTDTGEFGMGSRVSGDRGGEFALEWGGTRTANSAVDRRVAASGRLNW